MMGSSSELLLLLFFGRLCCIKVHLTEQMLSILQPHNCCECQCNLHKRCPFMCCLGQI